MNKTLGRMTLTDSNTWLADLYEGTPETVRTRDPEQMTLVAHDVPEDEAHSWIMGELDFS